MYATNAAERRLGCAKAYLTIAIRAKPRHNRLSRGHAGPAVRSVVGRGHLVQCVPGTATSDERAAKTRTGQLRQTVLMAMGVNNFPVSFSAWLSFEKVSENETGCQNRTIGVVRTIVGSSRQWVSCYDVRSGAWNCP